MPSCRAASTLAWPAIRPPSSPTSAGLVQPHSLMLAAMAGPDPCDPHSLGLPVPDFVAGARAGGKTGGDLKGLRIAWRPLLGNSVVAGEVRNELNSARSSVLVLAAETRIEL